MEKVKLYGENYEIKCYSCDAYAIVNNGGTETEPSNCPFCGSSNFSMEIIEVEI